jgi:hypothetical protein
MGVNDVLEYYVVPMSIVLFLYPLGYLPLPFISTIVYIVSIAIGFASMTNKMYRQSICLFVRDLFTNKESRKDGKYIPGHEGEFHRFLQTLCHLIECVHSSSFNITHNPRSLLENLNSTNITLSKAIETMTTIS